jgi:hypothetical protein
MMVVMAARAATFTIVVASSLACHSRLPAPVDPPPPTTYVEGDPTGGPVSGFVLYANNLTIVIGEDGNVTSADGLWVLDDGVAPVSVARHVWLDHTSITALGLPSCPCDDAPGACSELDLTTLDPEHAWSCTCVRPSDLRADLPVPDPAGFDGEAFDPCSTEGDLELASLVGGQLFALGWTWNGACYMSLSIYDSLALALPIVANPVEPSMDGFEVQGCDEEHPPAQLVRPWPPPDEHELGMCPEDFEPEAELLVLRRGWLWRIADNIFHAGGTRWISRVPARPDNCPSANDPCGDPSRYPGIDDYDEFWIRTDGSVALGAIGKGYALVRPSGSATLPFELEVDATHDLIGVRVHEDLAPLRQAIARGRELPQPAALQPDACK